ncbi:MAG: hypothetical protein HQL77_17865 [Magnetococcales bacterium]|nr:hypothetical protein [Magnetococcales bacterium]MBF0437212.1 hypothetical protein [Magnetococcales bacterium]
MTNTLNQLRTMPVGNIVALPARELMALYDKASMQLELTKSIVDMLDGVLTRRYADRAALLRKEIGKDFGTVRFDDGDVQVVADLPKRPVWNQKLLGEIAERIRRAGEDPSEYVEIAYKVAERKFTAWPQHIRETFEAARTLKAGKPTFKLCILEREASA